MRVALLQYPVVWAEVQENLRLTELRLRAIAGEADVAVLPEMFSTGFCTNIPHMADTMDGETMCRVRSWANVLNMAIVGTFMCKDGGNLYNRGFFVEPNGKCHFIDKRHLYPGRGESELFTAGTERPIVEYKGVKFCLQICYDLRFPVWTRNKSGFDYDILIYCSAWPDVKIQAWDVMLASRCLENQCYLVGVNCVGDDGLGLHYKGHSVAYDTRLQRLVWFEDDEEGTKIADFDMDRLTHFRKVLPLWKDSDRFEIEEVSCAKKNDFNTVNVEEKK